MVWGYWISLIEQNQLEQIMENETDTGLHPTVLGVGIQRLGFRY